MLDDACTFRIVICADERLRLIQLNTTVQHAYVVCSYAHMYILATGRRRAPGTTTQSVLDSLDEAVAQFDHWYQKVVVPVSPTAGNTPKYHKLVSTQFLCLICEDQDLCGAVTDIQYVQLPTCICLCLSMPAESSG